MWGEIPPKEVEVKQPPELESECMETQIDSVENTANTPEICAKEAKTDAPSERRTNQDVLFAAMIDRVAKSDGHFKHQQRNEPDLSYEEKSGIAKKLHEDKPDQFLLRFGKYLVADDLLCFKHLESDYTIQFYLGEVKKLLDSKRSQTNVKNRRYQAMLKMTKEGTYFSDEEMQERDPLLYEQMVGQFVTEEEAQEKIDKSDLKFSTILMSHMKWNETNDICNAQKDIEEGQEEESEDDEDEDEQNGEEDEKWVPSEKERSVMHLEFLHTMQERFMSGKDKEFDYSTVDDNTEYDNLDIREQDEVEKYFDQEEPEDADEGMDCSVPVSVDDSQFKMPVRKRQDEDG